MVDQDEISFIAQQQAQAPEPGAAVGFIEPVFGEDVEARQAREFVLFTPGHTVTGKVHIFGQTDLAGFVDATDPRFVPVTDVSTRSLADRRIVSRYEFILINRTQMIAAAEVGPRSDMTPAGRPRALGASVSRPDFRPPLGNSKVLSGVGPFDPSLPCTVRPHDARAQDSFIASTFPRRVHA